MVGLTAILSSPVWAAGTSEHVLFEIVSKNSERMPLPPGDFSRGGGKFVPEKSLQVIHTRYRTRYCHP